MVSFSIFIIRNLRYTASDTVSILNLRYTASDTLRILNLRYTASDTSIQMQFEYTDVKPKQVIIAVWAGSGKIQVQDLFDQEFAHIDFSAETADQGESLQ